MPHGDSHVSPLAVPQSSPPRAVRGVRLGVAASGQRYLGRDDMLLVELASGTTLVSVFTTSAVIGAPIRYNRQRDKRGTARALLVNAGNANVLSGKSGMDALPLLASAVGRALRVDDQEVFFASTGVIGEPFDAAPLIASLPAAVADLSPDNYQRAAAAIMTTDTYAKYVSATCSIGGVEVTISGIAKGSGMIAPNMATMLVFIFTDAPLKRDAADRFLRAAVADTFNAITVDGDTSPSDIVMMFCTHQAKLQEDLTAHAHGNGRGMEPFQECLREVCWALSDAVVRDGEGASKLIAIGVSGARNNWQARKAAGAVAQSPLVKTAISGGDPNWGRVAMAIGKSGIEVAAERMTISMGGHTVLRGGSPCGDMAAVAEALRAPEVDIAINLGVGDGAAQVRTCDLSEGYIAINRDYRS